MPKPDKKTNKEPNRYYTMLMGFANSALSDAYRVSLVEESTGEEEESIGKEEESTGKEDVLECIAKALAYAELADEHGFRKLPEGSAADADAFEKIRGEADQKAKRIRNTAEFEAVLGRMDQQDLNDFLGREKTAEEKKHDKGNPFAAPKVAIGFGTFAKNYVDKIREKEPEVKQARIMGMVQELQMSTQKSFVGRLKSIFVGDSKQYKAAFNALRDFATYTGVDEKERDRRKQQAINAAESYIINRSGVRDHQYGRDRFDAMMKSLGELMTPEDFQTCCNDVSNWRREMYGSDEYKIDPKKYLLTKASRKAFEEMEEKQRAEKAKSTEVTPEKERAKSRLRGEEEIKKAKEAETAERKEEMIQSRAKMDADNILRDEEVKDAKGSNNMTLAERNQKNLERLRTLDTKDLTPTDGRYLDIRNRLENHPAFRLAAEPIIIARKLEGYFTVPKTHTEKMKQDVVDTLKRQVDELNALDQQKQQEVKGAEPTLG